MPIPTRRLARQLIVSLMVEIAGVSLVAGACAQAADASVPATPQPGSSAAPGAPAEEELPPLSPEGEKLAEELRVQLSAEPEALLMLEAIVSGSQMGSKDGWFATAKAQTRYDWETLCRRFDADHDGRIGREEFPGSDDEFRRLDRNRSQKLEAEDLSWTESALARSPATQFFFRADRNSNGRLTREEFDALFDQIDRDGAGELCVDDLKDALTPRPGGPAPDDPSRDILLKGLAQQELGAWNAGPAVGEPAPDFVLKTIDGAEEVRLSDHVREKPLVLIFGNFTCGPFRAHSGNAERVFRRYHDRAEFLMVYVREAHPVDGWRMDSNDDQDVKIAQPKSLEARAAVAQRCREHLDLPWTVVVDGIDDPVGRAYSGMPSRLYVIDTAGTVAYKSGRGPFGFKPAEMEQALIWLLAERAAAEPAASKGAAENSAPSGVIVR